MLLFVCFQAKAQEELRFVREVLNKASQTNRISHTLKKFYKLTRNRNASADSLLFFALLGEKKARIENDPVFQVKFMEKIGDAYRFIGLRDSAYKYFHEALLQAKSPVLQARLLRKKGEEMMHRSQANSALVYFQRAKMLAEKNEYYEELIKNHIELAELYLKKASLPQAEKFLRKAEELEKKHENPFLRSEIWEVYARIYTKKGVLTKLLDYVLKNQKLAENLRDSIVKAVSYNLSGTYYTIKRDSAKGLMYFRKALVIWKQLKHLEQIAAIWNNIGIAYYYNNQPEEALKYYFKSLELLKKLSSNNDITTMLLNIGGVYNTLYKSDSALYYFNQALKEKRKRGDFLGEIMVIHNIAFTYKHMGKYSLALENLRKAYNLAMERGLLNVAKSSLSHLYEIYEETEKYDSALIYYKKYRALQDSLEGNKVRRILLEKEIEFKFQKEKELQQAKFEAREKVELIIIATVATVLAVSLVFLVLLARKYSTVNKQKDFIEEQQKILIEKNIEIQKQQEKQNEILEKLRVKNRKILDSLQSARKIQQALFETSNAVRKELPEHFLFFSPREIVSGDFYWIRKKEDKVFIAIADCTGHGVPAAFLTILGMTYLDKILDSGNETPAKMLDTLKEMIVKTLNIEKGAYHHKEGMDISLIKLNLKNQELEYAGAYNSLYILTSNSEVVEHIKEESGNFLREHQQEGVFLCEILPDKQPIGVGYRKPHPFTNHKFKLTASEEIVLFTDGFADQFGGRKAKKFGYKWFKNLFLRLYKFPVREQRKLIEKTFYKWMGNYEQIDDVLVFAMRCDKK